VTPLDCGFGEHNGGRVLAGTEGVHRISKIGKLLFRRVPRVASHDRHFDSRFGVLAPLTEAADPRLT